MISRALSPRTGTILSAALLTAILGWLVADRVMLVKRGHEIVLPIVPVDPRDLFKGDYARLAFDLVCEAGAENGTRRPPAVVSPANRGETVYVTLEKHSDVCWRQVAQSSTYPTQLSPGQIVLKGRRSARGANRVAFGIERYYVPEGEGRRIEDLARKGALAAIVAVGRDGRAAIKRLMIDGKPVYEEPMF